MARVLAISSQVARGAIGLSAVVPALQALGHDVIALPAILLSNHPGHSRFAGERVSPDLLRRMLDALEANAWLGGIDAVLTGYLPSAEHVAVAADAIARVRAAETASRRALYLCDPVIGDWPKGIYIDPSAAAAIRDKLVPIADILTPNVFELGWLTGHDVVDLATTITAAAASRAPTVVATSVPMSAGAALANVAVGPDRTAAWTSVPRRARVANGTGDLFAALLLGHRLRGCRLHEAVARATAGVEHVVALSLGLEELALAPHLASVAAAPPCAIEAADAAPGEP